MIPYKGKVQEGEPMDEAWMDFCLSGKVDDYLRYKNVMSERKSRTTVRCQQEERPDGTEYRSDRNGLTSYADWRV